MVDHNSEESEFLKKLIDMLPERNAAKKNEMKSSKEADKRYDDMKQFFTSKRQDRGDERAEKVADYLKNLNLDSEDESISEDEEEFKDSQRMKKKNDVDIGRMGSYLKKTRQEESLTSSTETGSTLSLSDLSIDSEEEDLEDEVVKDPFGKKKYEKNPKTNKLRKPKYEDMDKGGGKKSSDVTGLMDSLMNLEKKINPEKKTKGGPDKGKSGKASMKELQKHIDKRLTKLNEQNDPIMDLVKAKKNKKLANSSGSSDLSPEEEFFKYLQGTKGKKILESIGKKVDVSPSTKNALEESLAEFSRSRSSKGTAKTMQSTKMTEPSRPLPNKKLIAKEPYARLPDTSAKTGTISKVPTKDISTKSKMTIAAKDPTKLGALTKESKMVPTKLEAKPEAFAKKVLKKVPPKK
ncbi:uncharacterized protein isoform X1 [Rhodnius prolixus]|uniref:uncharacterized protein isoform X1 n=1 Tax=Rhodnius prolixus TaxID=13249 RepID=UPI003D18EF5F